MEQGEDSKKPIFRDIRRYFCEFCGICRSKKSLIAAHMLTHHKEEVEKAKTDGDCEKVELKTPNTCSECGISFKKPAYLKQHMQSHSLERQYRCSVQDCHCSYRRKDHLTRHLLQHQGKLFKCPIENCNREFSIQGNMKRHLKELHDEDEPPSTGTKQCVCQEIGCGKAFKYPSQLQKHMDSHVKMESSEAFCAEPGCMKPFANEQCLRAHMQSCHQHITCEICGTKQLKKNIKRHLCTHEAKDPAERVTCNYKNCNRSFSNKSNLRLHVKAVHLKEKPFACSFSGCGMRFSYKHVRDHHEKTATHVYTHGDFVEMDEQFRSRPRGGMKRKYPTIEMLVRKRVTPPNLSKESNDYLSCLDQQAQDNT